MIQPANIQRRLLNVDEAAQYLNIGRRRMWQLLKDGDVLKVRIGSSTRVDQSDLDDYVERLKAQA